MDIKQPKTDDLQKNFDQEIEALISVLAEICVHEYLTSKEKETENVEQ